MLESQFAKDGGWPVSGIGIPTRGTAHAVFIVNLSFRGDSGNGDVHTSYAAICKIVNKCVPDVLPHDYNYSMCTIMFTPTCEEKMRGARAAFIAAIRPGASRAKAVAVPAFGEGDGPARRRGWHASQQYTVRAAMAQVRTGPLHRPQCDWL